MVFILYFTVHNQQLLPLRIFITDHVSLHEVSTEQQTRKNKHPTSRVLFLSNFYFSDLNRE